MCYDRRRAEAWVDESARHAQEVELTRIVSCLLMRTKKKKEINKNVEWRGGAGGRGGGGYRGGG